VLPQITIKKCPKSICLGAIGAEDVKKHRHKKIMPIIDRGMLHNHVHLCKHLVCEAITVYHHLFFTNFSPFNKGLEEQGKKRRIKGKTMAQWMNLLGNNSFIN